MADTTPVVPDQAPAGSGMQSLKMIKTESQEELALQEKEKTKDLKEMNEHDVKKRQNGQSNGASNQNVIALYWDKYLVQLDTNPYITRALTAGVLGACSEGVVRVVKKENILAKRAPYIRQFLLGLLWRGPLLTTWLRILGHIFRNRNQKQFQTVVAKVFVHETVWDSFFVATYMYLLGILDRRPPSEVAELVKKQFWPTYTSQLKVWPFVQMLNFWVMPFKLQVGFNNVVGIFMNAWITYRASQQH